MLNLHKFLTTGLPAIADLSSRTTHCIQVALSEFYMELKEAVALDHSTSISPDREWNVFHLRMVIDFRINYLVFVRSIREENFKFYVKSFIFRVQLCLWLSIHLFDLTTVVVKNKLTGFFSSQKLKCQFLQMGLDQIHKQNNRTINMCGGWCKAD